MTAKVEVRMCRSRVDISKIRVLRALSTLAEAAKDRLSRVVAMFVHIRRLWLPAVRACIWRCYDVSVPCWPAST